MTEQLVGGREHQAAKPPDAPTIPHLKKNCHSERSEESKVSSNKYQKSLMLLQKIIRLKAWLSSARSQASGNRNKE